MAFVFGTSRLVTGSGSIKGIGGIASPLGKKALLVTGKGGSLRRSGALDRVLESLDGAGVECHVLECVEPEPSLATTEAVIGSCRSVGADLVIAMGGGSALDVGKAAAALAPSAISLRDAFSRGIAIDGPGLPCIAVPTTSGTGSEVTFNSVLTDKDTLAKLSIRGQALLPTVALLDPELTLGLPPKVTAYTGMDAYTQALESLVSRHASPVTDAMALQAIRLISVNLREAFENGGDLAAREAVAYGSLLAGMALANARLGAVHGMAHSLGARLALPHGLVCAVLLPYVVSYNWEAAESKYAMAAKAIGISEYKLLPGIRETIMLLGLPYKLSQVGLTEDIIEKVVEESLPSGSLKANPREMDADAIRNILRANL